MAYLKKHIVEIQISNCWAAKTYQERKIGGKKGSYEVRSRDRGNSPVVEHSSSLHKALVPMPSTTNKETQLKRFHKCLKFGSELHKY